MTAASVVVAQPAPAHGEQLHLGPPCHEPLTRVKNVVDMPRLRCDNGYPNLGPPMQLQRADFSGGHLEFAQSGDDRTDI